MSAIEPITTQISKYNHDWEDLFWAMAKGDVLAYKEIKKMNVLNFWGFFDRWKKEQEAEIKKHRKK